MTCPNSKLLRPKNDTALNANEKQLSRFNILNICKLGPAVRNTVVIPVGTFGGPSDIEVLVVDEVEPAEKVSRRRGL